MENLWIVQKLNYGNYGRFDFLLDKPKMKMILE